jgi:segregation and condensation protein A
LRDSVLYAKADLMLGELSEAGSVPDTKKTIAQPPLNLLFNPSILAKKDVWNVDIVGILQLFLNLLNATGNKDLRICGIAAVSSSMIYRLKVESIFLLEKIAMQKRGLQDQEQLPIPDLNTIELPFRVESTYPVSVEDLMKVLENMIMELAHPKPHKKQVELEPVQTFDFDQYLVKFEQIIQKYEDMIFDIVSADGSAMFKTLVEKMDPVEMARCFIAMLYLAMKDKVDLEQQDDSDDVRITLKQKQ